MYFCRRLVLCSMTLSLSIRWLLTLTWLIWMELTAMVSAPLLTSSVTLTTPVTVSQPNDLIVLYRGTWWRLGWDDDFQPEGHGFDCRSSRHIGTLGKSCTCSCLCASAWNSDTVFVWCSRERLWVVEDLKERYRNGRNEWMNCTCIYWKPRLS